MTSKEMVRNPIGFNVEVDSNEIRWFIMDIFFQLVVPNCFRKQILSLANGSVAGHYSLSKTYYRIRHFFWPCIKSVTRQMVGHVSFWIVLGHCSKQNLVMCTLTRYLEVCCLAH